MFSPVERSFVAEYTNVIHNQLEKKDQKRGQDYAWLESLLEGWYKVEDEVLVYQSWYITHRGSSFRYA